jgi:hypothetical protein
MSGPTRWRDDGPAGIRELLDNAPKSRAMTQEQKSRTGNRVARLAALPLTAGMLFWVQSVALGAGLGVASLVVATQVVPGWGASSARPSPPPVATTPRGTIHTTVPVASSDREGSSEAVSEKAAPLAIQDTRPSNVALDKPTETPLPALSGSVRSQDSLSREAELLEQARAELGGNPSRALAIAQEHASRFPSGKLSIERELVAVDALQRLGRTQEARARGDALLARSPGSLYEQRIRSILSADRK